MTIAPRPWVGGLDPYVPGRPAVSEDGSLASNESAFGASPAVRAAIVEAAGRVHRYPSPLADDVRAALASELGVGADNILVGNGSDELVYLLVIAFAAMGGRIVCADPPYQMHDIVPRALGCQVTRVPLLAWAHDLQAMAGVEAELAFVCNPHNPTGTAVARSQIARFAAHSKAGLVVVDEAYIDFADDPPATTALDLLPLGNVVVTRTFSKLHGLAGLRIGYLAGPATWWPPCGRCGHRFRSTRSPNRPRSRRWPTVTTAPGSANRRSLPGMRRRRCSNTPATRQFLPRQTSSSCEPPTRANWPARWRCTG